MQMRASEDVRRDGVIQWRTSWKTNNGRLTWRRPSTGVVVYIMEMFAEVEVKSNGCKYVKHWEILSICSTPYWPLIHVQMFAGVWSFINPYMLFPTDIWRRELEPGRSICPLERRTRSGNISPLDRTEGPLGFLQVCWYVSVISNLMCVLKPFHVLHCEIIC